MKQHFENYSSQDHQVWNTLFDRQFENLQDKAVAYLYPCLEVAKAALNGSGVPDFELLSPALEAATGWSIEVVPGLIPVEDFFQLLEQRRFPSSTWLRKPEQLDYLEEPDMFHDVFGHIPLLFNPQYADFMQCFGALGLSCADSPEWVAALERLYWFTIEFGVCGPMESKEIYGAGILSSFGESKQIYVPGACEFRPFELDAVLNHQFQKHIMQAVYYVLPDFESLFGVLDAVAAKVSSSYRAL